MSSETHTDPDHLNRADASDDFVVPEPDGVKSGIPFDVADDGARPAPAGTPARVGAAADAGRTLQARRGMSLKLKLLLSLGLLTLVIVLLGLVSVLTLHSISAVGVPELNQHAALARQSEALANSIHRLYETEQDMRRGDSQSAERLQRRLTEVRQQLTALEVYAAKIETVERDLTGSHAAMADLLGAYEDQIEAYAAALASAAARSTDAQAAEAELAADLDRRLMPALEGLAGVAAAHWRRGGATGAEARVAPGLLLAELERNLWRIAADVQRFLATGKVALAEAARGSLTEVLAQLDVASSEASGRSVREGLSDVREQLLAFAVLLRDAGERVQAAQVQAAADEQQLAEAARSLHAAGNGLLDESEVLTADAWGDIERESADLRRLGEGARWLVGIAAALGTAIGVLVLVTVPRPIMRNIDVLLAGAREIARGNLSTPVHSDSRDELGQLATTFEQMRRNLLTLVQRIQHASVQLSSSINEIQAAATEQASSSAEQASAVNELTASLNEMSQSASTLLSSSESVDGNVGEITQTLGESDQASTRILSSMDAIGLSTEQTAERIKALNDKMDDINEAVATISMVADQTTLLSLNASIEANKAGEMGKGFSVVANEIRRLSDRSIDSAGNINGMVRDIQRATESSALAMDKSSEEIRHGVTLVRESIDALASITEAMERIQGQMSMILDSVRAQAESARMVQSTATEMLSSANMVSKAAGQTRSVTYELNAMATQLADAVSVFRV